MQAEKAIERMASTQRVVTITALIQSLNFFLRFVWVLLAQL